jgi:hypothetical protein
MTNRPERLPLLPAYAPSCARRSQAARLGGTPDLLRPPDGTCIGVRR